MTGEQKKIYWERLIAGVLYFIFGVLILRNHAGTLNYILEGFHANEQSVHWCVAFSSLGIGIGLINTRNHPTPSDFCWCINWPLHFIGYSGFVLVVISLTSFIAGAAACGESFDFTQSDAMFYPAAALTGLVGGFFGHSLQDLVGNLLNKKG